MVYIIGIHMQTHGTKHEHIEQVEWLNPITKKEGRSSVAEMVDFIDNKNGTVKVTDGQNTVMVGTVDDAKPKHIRSYADRVWTNNLLALPRY